MLSRFRSRPHDTGELEPVAADVVDPEELRYAPRPPRRRRATRVLLVVLPLLLLGALLWGGWTWSQEQYFVADDGESVAIYRGVQVDLPLVDLNHVEEPTDLALEDLTSYNRGLVEDGIEADSLTGARKIVANLARDKEKSDCPKVSPSPTRSPKKSASPQATRSPSASPTASPSGDAAECESPSPSPTKSSGPSASPSGDGA